MARIEQVPAETIVITREEFVQTEGVSDSSETVSPEEALGSGTLKVEFE